MEHKEGEQPQAVDGDGEADGGAAEHSAGEDGGGGAAAADCEEQAPALSADARLEAQQELDAAAKEAIEAKKC